VVEGGVNIDTSDPHAFLEALTVGAQHTAARNDDAVRIRDLPVIDPYDPGFAAVALAWASDKWSRGPVAPMHFRDIQASALLSISRAGGGLLPIGTGWGKTLISLLAADALGARRPLLLIPPAMRLPFENARRDYNRSFKVPTNLRVMAYSQLSTSTSTDALDRLAPDVIVADEAHNLRHMDAARTKRVARYLKKNPHVKCVWMSGTLTSKSIRDYAHLSEWALKNGSPAPLPAHFPQLQAFSAVLDARAVKGSGENRYAASAQVSDFVTFSPLFPDWSAYSNDTEDEEDEAGVKCSPRVARARAIYRKRLGSTPGVVSTSSASVGASLRFMERRLEVPEVIGAHLEHLEKTWTRPDGEELVDAIAKWRCGRQLTQGFFYRWKWPGGIVDKDWMGTRSAWHREVRQILQRNVPHLDSPLLVTQAVRRALAGEPSLVSDDMALLEAYKAWEPHSHKRWGRGRTPPTETVWCDDYLIQDALRWLDEKENRAGLLWYEDNAVGDKLAEAGVRVYGSGTNPEEIQGAFAAALSIAVHSDGKNLQKHHRNLMLSWPPSGKTMEQLVSRTHRAGQEEDEVFVDFYHHTEPAMNAVATARNDARYIEETTGVTQRLLFGDWIFHE
jgi:hypothetical protein